ncbi:PspC domain-containing protein [Actinomyces sp. HMSC035G02]|uniref:PspC domain-containing protein n=1 Tax=Actinomyces sp. HMSC035G02 TaxID=1739406 RepID=UPI002570D6E6|nr:PspC domain-containing protein [Actinomyces sp. HMSC035G02]
MSWPNGTTDPGAQYQQRPPRNSFFDAVRGSGWYRAQERAIGGVCSGIAAHQGWDLSLVRVLMVVATFCMPVVAIAYGLAWLLLPEAADGRIHLEETLEGRFDIAVIGGVFMILAGLSSSLSAVGIIGGLGLGWIQLLALAAGITAVVVVLVSVTRSASGGPQTGANRTTPQYGNPQYGNPQYGAPQYGNPQYGTPQQQASAAGASDPFGHSAPGAEDTGTTMPQQQNTQAPEGFPAYGVPAGSAGSAGAPRPTGATSAAQGTNAGPRPAAARPGQPHPGWTTPPTAPRPRQWTPRPMPTHRPRTVSSRVNLAITGLLILVVAAVFAGIYMVDKGPAIPFITGETEGQTIARIITVGGGVCLLIVGFSLAIAALRDRSAGWLTTLSVIGMVMALPTGLVGSQASHPTDFLINTHVGAIGNQTTLDWTVDEVSGGNPTSATTLDLTGAPVGTTKTITVDWRAWSRLTIQMAEGQPVQIICQSSIDDLTTNMDGNGWAEPLNNCSGVTVSSPAWGKPSLGGITILITDDADIDTLTIVQSPDTSGTWGSTPAPAATPSATPSATPTPSPTPTGSQSGN